MAASDQNNDDDIYAVCTNCDELVRLYLYTVCIHYSLIYLVQHVIITLSIYEVSGSGHLYRKRIFIGNQVSRRSNFTIRCPRRSTRRFRYIALL